MNFVTVKQQSASKPRDINLSHLIDWVDENMVEGVDDTVLRLLKSVAYDFTHHMIELRRVGHERHTDNYTNRVEIVLNGVKYTLTNRHGELKIHSHSDKMSVLPGCANEVAIVGQTF